MFGKQFSLIAQEEEALKELRVFAILVYIDAWFTASEAIEAPRWDLALLKIPFSTKQLSLPHLLLFIAFLIMMFLLKQSSTWLPSFKTKMMNKIL